MVKFFGEITFNLRPDEGNERKTHELKDNIDSQSLQKQTQSSRVHFCTEFLSTVSSLKLTNSEPKTYSPLEQRICLSSKSAF